MSDAIKYPNSEVNVTAPALGITVSKSSNLTVTWDCVKGSDNTIVVQLTGDTTGAVEEVTRDNGSLTIPSSALSAFVVGGRVNVAVTRIVYKDTTGGDNRAYAMGAYSQNVIYHRIVP